MTQCHTIKFDANHDVLNCSNCSFVDELPQGFLGEIHLQLLSLNGGDCVDGFNENAKQPQQRPVRNKHTYIISE